MRLSPANDLARSRPVSTPSFFLFAGVVFFAFDDLGVFGTSARVFQAPGWIFLAAYVGLMWKSRPRFSGRAWLVVLICITITLLSLFVLPATARGEELAVKAGKVGLSLSAMWVCFSAGSIAFRRHRSVTSAAVCVLLTISIAGVFLSDQLELSSLFHSTPNFAQRTRGLRFEASSLGAGILVFGALFCTLARSSAAKVTCVLIVIWTVSLYVPSRGAITSIVIVVLLYFTALVFHWVHRRAAANSFGVLVATSSLVLSFGLPFLVALSGWQGMSRDISDASRSVWAMASLQSLIIYPLGQGLAMPTVTLGSLLSLSATDLVGVFGYRNMTEVFSLAASNTDNALLPKTFPNIAAVYGGAVFLYAWLRCLVALNGRLFARIPMTSGILPLIVLVVVSSSFYSSIFAWEQAFLFGVLWSLSQSQTLFGPSAMNS